MRLPTLVSRWLEWPRCLGVGMVLRLVLVAFACIQDASSVVPYSDVDYSVYSDAALRMAEGGSPYERATYRYTPLLAALLLPGVIWPLFGKLVFVACDLVLAWLVRSVLLTRGLTPRRATIMGGLPVLLNPLVINLSTRGNADILIVALVVAMLHALLRGRVRTAAVLYGLAVHTKIYPIIYAPAIVLFLNQHYPSSSDARSSQQRPQTATTARSFSSSWLADLLHPGSMSLKLSFFVYSAGTFFALTGACYYAYGYEFLFETYLYHVTRVDTRHNFSTYFYQLYLECSGKQAATAPIVTGAVSMATLGDRLLPLLSFLPQVSVLGFFSLCLYRDLPLCIFAQTLVFVAFNKVVTAQYFLWWLVPLIIVAPQSRLTWKNALVVGSGWMATELHWLNWGFQLEFLGRSVFFEMWLAGLVFFLANCALLAIVLWNHRFQPVFRDGVCTTIEDDQATPAKAK